MNDDNDKTGEFDFFNNVPRDLSRRKKTRADQIEKRFRDFHQSNPKIWSLFKRFTNELIAAGFEHYSSVAVYNRIRWHVDLETQSLDGLKINDHYSPYYARMFHVAYPEHDGFFKNRKLTSATKPARGIDVAVFDQGPPADESELNARLKELI